MMDPKHLDALRFCQMHPIWQAIDRGGGQTCDVAGILVALDNAGYVILPKDAPPQSEPKP